MTAAFAENSTTDTTNGHVGSVIFVATLIATIAMSTPAITIANFLNGDFMSSPDNTFYERFDAKNSLRSAADSSASTPCSTGGL